tara:strand:+ start:648 stop:908 length:261 start_codon:yes stop_codon:yes gene_type:complete
MTTITSSEFQRQFSLSMDKALTGPVKIMHHKRCKAVLISQEHYNNLMEALAVRAFKSEDMPEDLRRALSKQLTEAEFEAGGIQNAG